MRSITRWLKSCPLHTCKKGQVFNCPSYAYHLALLIPLQMSPGANATLIYSACQRLGLVAAKKDAQETELQAEILQNQSDIS